MQDISRSALQFFQKYASGGSGLEFAADFGKKEENPLYVEYEKLGNW